MARNPKAVGSHENFYLDLKSFNQVFRGLPIHKKPALPMKPPRVNGLFFA